MPSKKVLVVDDDRRITRLIVELLQSRQYLVDVAYTGKEALEKVCHCPDVVLLDLK